MAILQDVLALGEKSAAGIGEILDTKLLERINLFRSWITEQREESAIPRPMTLFPPRSKPPSSPLQTEEEWRAAGALLCDALLGPAIDALPHDSMLRLAPDGDIARLPFAALPYGDRFLIDAFEIAGLDALDAAARLAGDSALAGYHLFPSVRGDLLMKLGRFAEASEEIQRAIAMAKNLRERELLAERLKQIEKAASCDSSSGTSNNST